MWSTAHRGYYRGRDTASSPCAPVGVYLLVIVVHDGIIVREMGHQRRSTRACEAYRVYCGDQAKIDPSQYSNPCPVHFSRVTGTHNKRYYVKIRTHQYLAVEALRETFSVSLSLMVSSNTLFQTLRFLHSILHITYMSEEPDRQKSVRITHEPCSLRRPFNIVRTLRRRDVPKYTF